MSSVHPFPESPKKSDHEEPAWRKFVDAIRLLLDSLPSDQQQRAIEELSAALCPIPAPRAGETLGTIVRLLPAKREWTVGEIKDGVAARGVEASNKEIYNSLGYLVRKGRVRRIGYGHYAVGGAGIVTSDDLGGEPPPMEDGEI